MLQVTIKQQQLLILIGWLLTLLVFTMIEHITQVIVFTVYKKNIITSTDFLAKLKSGF